MAKNQPPPTILVLGDHPSAYIAAALIAHNAKLQVIHATLPNENSPDRLVIVNPALFSLHKSLEGMRRQAELTPVYGLRFIADDGSQSEHRSKTILSYVSTIKSIRQAARAVAQAEGVQLVTPKQLEIHSLDEGGLDVTLGKTRLRPLAAVLAGSLPTPEHKRLGLPETWGEDVLHRYSYVRIPAKGANLGARPVVPMSLNLRGTLSWGWLLPGPKGLMMSVVQPVDSVATTPPVELLRHWAGVLAGAGIIPAKQVSEDSVESVDIPLAGALATEGVANRTLLVGPAGGFFSACSEDIYPGCWSAVFAADAIKKAIKEPHLQDALNPYRHRWRTTLGDYLRGPQQNFRFLLPLVYRNQVMTTRLTESILLGKSVVR